MPQRLRLFAPLQHGVRGSDAWGDGAFGASRGNRKHKGPDYLAAPGECVGSVCDGVIRRIGRCYVDTAEYKLVEIATDGALARLFYVNPEVLPGDEVRIGDTIGYAQDISKRYPPEKLSKRSLEKYLVKWGASGLDDLTPQQLDQLRMKNHVHFEVRLTKNVLVGRGRSPNEAVWVNPRLFMGGDLMSAKPGHDTWLAESPGSE